MPESFNDANQRMADRFSRGAPARGITSVAGSIRSAAGTVGGRGNWTAEAAKANSDAALRAAQAEGGPIANARAVDAGPQGQEGPSAGSINALAVQRPFDSSVPEELRIAPLEPLSFAVPRYSNIDAPFDELLTPSSGGGGAGDNPFTISDATSGSTELILVSPGLLEVINGGFSTFITPTLGGDPITDQTPIAAVSGVVYLEVTINAGSGIPTAAAVKNAATLPADTATLKHIQIGEITVGTSVVTVDSQDVTSNVLYHVRADPFRASTKLSGSDVVLAEVAGGLVLVPRTFAPALTVAAADAGASNTHCWCVVEWSSTYVLNSAALAFGTAWPATYDSAADRKTNVPIAYISGGLVQLANSHLMMHRTLTTGGFVWLPASL